MAEHKHTPGPWVWRGKSGSLHQVGEEPYRFGKTVLAPTYGYEAGAETEVSDPDACLIAAAPDLLKACQAVADVCADDSERRMASDGYTALELVLAAIAKATGEAAA
ncbi:hypothetical protein [Kaistia sp. MMO-174]|uniref:hypothetical protein n=1 Tax=Kaistia sp. MMO-174 TaxID=3081256 RepID=UPI003016E33A